MARSYTEVDDKGFWCSDWLLAVAAALLGESLELAASLPEFAARLRLESTTAPAGCISLRMNEHLADPIAARTFEQLLSALMLELQTRERVSAKVLHDRGVGGPGCTYVRDIPVTLLLEVYDAMADLVARRWPYDASDSPVLPTLPSDTGA